MSDASEPLREDVQAPAGEAEAEEEPNSKNSAPKRARTVQVPVNALKPRTNKPPGLGIVRESMNLPQFTDMYAKYMQPDFVPMAHQVENGERFIRGMTCNAVDSYSSMIVCDQPGLGKTTSALLCANALRSVASPENEWFKTLIVTPASLQTQWSAEIQHFTRTGEDKIAIGVLNPSARYVIMSYEALARQFKAQYHSEESQMAKVKGKQEKVFRLNAWIDAPTLPFLADHFKLVIFDEIHKVRNDSTQIFNACKYVLPTKGVFGYPRLGLTATPVINRLHDLANVGKVLRFDPLYTDPMYFESEVHKEDASFRKTVFIRHLKADVLELPKLNHDVQKLRMTEEEVEKQEEYRDQLINAFSEAKTGKGKFVYVLAALTRLRQVSIHPRLPDATMVIGADASKESDEDEDVDMEEDEESEDEESEDEETTADLPVVTESDEEFELEELGGESLADETIAEIAVNYKESTKFTWIVNNIGALLKTGSVLVYSSFSTPLQALQKMLHNECKVESGLYIGSTSRAHRVKLVQDFMAGTIPVLLLTYGSGGLGLNLAPTGRTVLHLDAPWAPAHLEQATDRVHRRGTVLPVNEIVLKMLDSTDQFILDSIHARKFERMSKIEKLSKTLRVSSQDAAMNMKNIGKMLDWFTTRRYRRRAPARFEE